MSVLIKYRIITKHTDNYLIIYPHQSFCLPQPSHTMAYSLPTPYHLCLSPSTPLPPNNSTALSHKNKEDGSQSMPVCPLVAWQTKCSRVCLINAWVIKRLVMDTSKNIFNVIQFNRGFYHIDPFRNCLKSRILLSPTLMHLFTVHITTI